MNTTPTTADPVALFNAHLAASKLAALRLLQDLMTSLADPAATVGAAIREIRLAATAILRTQPMKPHALSPDDGTPDALLPGSAPTRCAVNNPRSSLGQPNTHVTHQTSARENAATPVASPLPRTNAVSSSHPRPSPQRAQSRSARIRNAALILSMCGADGTTPEPYAVSPGCG